MSSPSSGRTLLIFGGDSGSQVTPIRNEPKLVRFSREQKVIRKTYSALAKAKERARAHGLQYSLTKRWALHALEQANFCCALSRVPLLLAEDFGSKVNPYLPSIDRVRPGGDYTPDNCQIVAFAMNAMLMDWGEDVFYKFANGYRSNRSKTRTKKPAPLAKKVNRCGKKRT